MNDPRNSCEGMDGYKTNGTVGASGPTTIESCASLLPSGHKFEVNITGNIDTTGNTRAFNGEFGLSDGTPSDNPALQQLAEPFVNCVSALLK